jgi:hypothetical protein|tara:strand:- start:30 stop:194 length:165 start_codon:yes stop_codon:yes gene_type:complete
MANKLKSINREKINLPKKKKETPNQRASTKKSLGKKKSAEVEALALTWNEDLCE